MPPRHETLTPPSPTRWMSNGNPCHDDDEDDDDETSEVAIGFIIAFCSVAFGRSVSSLTTLGACIYDVRKIV